MREQSGGTVPVASNIVLAVVAESLRWHSFVTRDPTRYRTYLPSLALIAPE